MNKDAKATMVAELKEKFSNADYFYLADSSTLNVADVNNLRRAFFNSDIKFKVVKNTLIKKALEQVEGKEYSDDLLGVLAGPTALIFTEKSNAPAKVIKRFLKDNPKLEKPVIKAAYIDSSVYIGHENLEALASLKSKDELLAEIIGLLQSPAKNVISALQSGGGKLAGILKTLSEREEA